MKTSYMVELSKLSITTLHNPPLLCYITKIYHGIGQDRSTITPILKHFAHHLHSILIKVNTTSPCNVPCFHQLLSLKISGVATEDAQFRRLRGGPPLTNLSLGGVYACVASVYSRMRAREQKALEAIAGSTALTLVLSHNNPRSPLELRLGFWITARVRLGFGLGFGLL